MEIIKSKNNEIIKSTFSLKQKKYREEYGLCLVEGLKILKEVVKNNFKIDTVFTTENFLAEVEKQNFDAKIVVVSEDILKYLCDVITPQGVVGTVKTKKTGFEMPKNNFLLLDNIQDPSNLGSILRTAVATNFTDIYLVNCCDEYSEKVIRTSMGNMFRCNFYHIGYEKVDLLKDMLYIADMNGTNIFTIRSFENIVGLAIGNEGHGVSFDVKSKITKCVALPMANNVESLNASVSAGILMYHIRVNQKEKLL